MKKARIALVAAIVGLLLAFKFLHLGQYLTLESLKSHGDEIRSYYDANPV